MVTYPSSIRRSAGKKPPRRWRTLRKQLRRTLPPILFGCLVMGLLCLIGVLLWALISYYGQYEPTAATGVPALIWLGSLFISSVLLTWFNRGGTVTPVLAVSLIATIVSFFLLPSPAPFFPALGKALLTMVAGSLGFAATKMLQASRQAAKPRKRKAAAS